MHHQKRWHIEVIEKETYQSSIFFNCKEKAELEIGAPGMIYPKSLQSCLIPLANKSKINYNLKKETQFRFYPEGKSGCGFFACISRGFSGIVMLSLIFTNRTGILEEARGGDFNP